MSTEATLVTFVSSDRPRPTTYVGANVPRGDGPAKVTGAALYVDDLTAPGMIHGATVRSPVPRGTLRGVDFAPDFDWSDVTVVMAADVPENVVALIEDDQPLLAAKEIRHCYEPVVLLACADRDKLARAVAAVTLRIDERPAVLSIDEALAARDPVHGTDNIQKKYKIEKGDTAAGMSRADLVVEGRYSVHHQEQMYIEPQGVIAHWDDLGVHVVGSLQCPYYVHKALKRAFQLEADHVHVTQAVTGGGFGGKEEYPSIIAAHAALLARKAGKPVKMIYGRKEDIEATTKRHPAVMHIRTGLKRDGTLTAVEVDVVMDGGAYVTLTPVVLSRGTLHASGPYRCENVRIEARAVATNTPPNGAFRGFGAPQTIWAIERHMDRIATKLGLDPLEYKRRSLYVKGDATATGQVLNDSVGGHACVEAALAKSEYFARREQYAKAGVETTADGRRVRRGIGASVFFHGAGFTGSGERRMKGKVRSDLLAGGVVRIRSTSTDIGQGTETVFRQIAADAAMIPIERVVVEQPSTTRAPDSGPTVASRTTMVVGAVVDSTARALRERVRAQVAADLRVGASAVVDKGEDFEALGKVVRFTDAADALLAREPDVFELHQYDPPGRNQWNDETYSGDAYPCYSWGCDIAEVEVDVDTFETRVTKFWAAQDVGKAIHPKMCAGQVEGGTLQAVGWALWESLVWDKGRIKNARMTNYIIPTSLDAPPFETILVEEPFNAGPFGAKGVGELPMDGGAPAVAAAVEHATGLVLDDLPLLPENLFMAYRTQRGERAAGVK